MSAPVRSYDPSNPRGGVQTPFFKLYITHLPTQQKIDFAGWVTEFSDGYTSNWNQETVYGRMDPLVTFQNTQRQISIGFDVVSGDTGQAVANLAAMSRLTQFLYPVYNIERYKEGDKAGQRVSTPTGMGMQNTLKASPLIGMKWTNLMANSLTGQQLIGYLDGFTYAPEMEYGGYIIGGGEGGITPSNDLDTTEGMSRRIDISDRSYIPKVVSVSLNYTVIHTHLMGWYAESGIGPATPGGDVPEGDYVFADKDINSKYPNAFMVKQDVTTVSNGEGEVVSSQVVQSNETEVLGG
tara:strand:- start:247 stop:1131 length:885 start_codon:yes stop_codon:yes gene_type:complete